MSELRLARAKTPSQAHRVLERYLPVHNRRFAKPARNAEPVWSKVTSLQIQQALCFKQRRTVAKDNTVTLMPPSSQSPSSLPFDLMPIRESMCTWF